MNPGKLDRRIVIQARTMTQDATGSRVETWADSATVWAEFVQHRGRKAETSDADKVQDAQQFRIRHRTLSISEHRIFYQLRFYTITVITPEGRGESILLDCIATQAAP